MKKPARGNGKEPRDMGASALPVILLFLLVFLSWRVVFSANKDLLRAKAWEPLLRRAMPFIVLTLMALSLFVVQGYRENQSVMVIWASLFAVAVVASNMLSMPRAERQASKSFRKGDYEGAVGQYRELVQDQPLARHHAFLGAALGAAGHDDEGVEESTKAIEKDPQYGIAYYNRGLILRRQKRRSRAKKDIQRALDADLPRRFRGSARGFWRNSASELSLPVARSPRHPGGLHFSHGPSEPGSTTRAGLQGVSVASDPTSLYRRFRRRIALHNGLDHHLQ